MNFDTWVAFALASTILVIIPGPTILSVISFSITSGRRVVWPLAAGVALGDAVALLGSIVGLGALLSTSAQWFVLVKWLGGLYLIYLGTRMFLNSWNKVEASGEITTTMEPTVQTTAGHQSVGHKPGKVFWQLFVVTALNPKGMVFFVAFLPQFVDPGAALLPQFLILSITFVVIGTLNAVLYALFASSAGSALQSGTARRRLDCCGGLLLGAAGLWALRAKQPV